MLRKGEAPYGNMGPGMVLVPTLAVTMGTWAGGWGAAAFKRDNLLSEHAIG